MWKPGEVNTMESLVKKVEALEKKNEEAKERAVEKRNDELLEDVEKTPFIIKSVLEGNKLLFSLVKRSAGYHMGGGYHSNNNYIKEVTIGIFSTETEAREAIEHLQQPDILIKAEKSSEGRTT